MTGKMNVRVEFYDTLKTQDAGGGIVSSNNFLFSMYALVEDRSGTQVTGRGTQLWNYDYKITVRQADDLPIKSNYKIKYDNKFIAIRSVSFENEGRRKNVVLRCSAIDKDV